MLLSQKKRKKGQCHSVFITHYKLKYIPSEEQHWLVCIRHKLQPRKGKEKKRKEKTTTTVAKRVVRGQALDLVQEQSFITGARDRVVVLVTSGFWAPSPLCSANAHATEGSSSSRSSCYGFTPPCCIAPPVGPV
jgi:hypothetical protein